MRRNSESVALVVAVLLASGTTLVAQGRRVWVELGAGSLAPDDPFAATLSMRGSTGWVLNGRNALALEYSRQSANGSEGDDLGRFARHFIGVTWQHAFRDAFDDQGSMTRQYLVRIGGGMLVRGTFPEAVGEQHLKTTTFVDAGLVIRYPLSSRVVAVGSIEDALGFLRSQTVRSYCGPQGGGSVCYPRGGPDYFTIDLAPKVQHNMGVFATLQLRL